MGKRGVWKNGEVEYWVVSFRFFLHYSIIPLFQHSIVPEVCYGTEGF